MPNINHEVNNRNDSALCRGLGIKNTDSLLPVTTCVSLETSIRTNCGSDAIHNGNLPTDENDLCITKSLGEVDSSIVHIKEEPIDEDILCSDGFERLGKVKEEFDMDIIKEEVDDTTSVETGFDGGCRSSFLHSEFVIPSVKRENGLLESTSEISSYHGSESESDEDNGRTHLSSVVKERAKILYQTLMDVVTSDGRRPIVAFLENPMIEFQPDYYNVITAPIDMKTIKERIKSNIYINLKQVKGDLMLMLHNAQEYYTSESQVYVDAEILNNVLHEKLKEMKESSQKYILPEAVAKQMKILYDVVRHYRNASKRRLSTCFRKLPTKVLFPDFYECVKQPVDLECIQRKIDTNRYDSLNSLFSDLMLLFQNASCYYDPESEIYRNALALQSVAIEKFIDIQTREGGMIDVVELVHNMIVALFNRVYNIMGSKGKYLSNSFKKLPFYEEINGKHMKILSFDIVKYRLDRGFYKRLDNFQNDLFTVFDKAREHSSLSSRLYSDSIAMQRKYLTIRDEIFRHESLALLKTRALDFREEDLVRMLENQRLQKVESTSTAEDDRKNVCSPVEKCEVGDFVYVKESEGILRIFRITDISVTVANKIFYGYQYYKPEETTYTPSQVIYEQEVFRTDKSGSFYYLQVTGKCLVLPEMEYKNNKVDNLDEKDVYICLYHYDYDTKKFTKLKNWCHELPSYAELSEREQPLEMKLCNWSPPPGNLRRKYLWDELEKDDECSVLNSNKNILKPLDKTKDGHLFYLQYSTSFGIIKLGDFIYVEPSGQRFIIHISRIFVSKEEKTFIVGLKYILAGDIPLTVKLQPEYKKEVYFTGKQETFSLVDMGGKCSVLNLKEYVTKRVTEIREKDVYLCKSFFDEVQQSISPLQSEIIKFPLPSIVQPDEIYFFIKAHDPEMIEKSCNSSSHKSCNSSSQKRKISEVKATKKPIEKKVKLAELLSKKKPTMEVSSAEKPDPSTLQGRHTIRAFINFSVSKRKAISEQLNKDCNFSDFCKLIAKKWAKLPQYLRIRYSNESCQMAKKCSSRIVSQSQMSGYNLFCSEMRRIVLSKFPNAKIGLVTHLLKMEWINLEEVEKAEFHNLASLCALSEDEADFLGFPKVEKKPAAQEKITSNKKVKRLHKKATDYSFLRLRICYVLLKALNIPLESTRSFMINDINDSLVFLVRPVDHLLYIREHFPPDKLETIVSERRYLCDKCGMTLRTQENMVCHMREHDKNCFYRCKICKPSLYFNKRRHLFAHLKKIHDQIKKNRSKHKAMDSCRKLNLKSEADDDKDSQPSEEVIKIESHLSDSKLDPKVNSCHEVIVKDDCSSLTKGGLDSKSINQLIPSPEPGDIKYTCPIVSGTVEIESFSTSIEDSEGTITIQTTPSGDIMIDGNPEVLPFSSSPETLIKCASSDRYFIRPSAAVEESVNLFLPTPEASVSISENSTMNADSLASVKDEDTLVPRRSMSTSSDSSKENSISVVKTEDQPTLIGPSTNKHRRHPKSHKSEQLEVFPCGKCSQIFPKKSEYNIHFFEHSDSATKTFKCGNCSIVFTLLFTKDSYIMWKSRKRKPLCRDCQIDLKVE